MISVGSYAALIRDAVALGDLSALQPLTVRDAIWLEVERHRAMEDRAKLENQKLKFLDRSLDNIHLVLLDIREILRNTNVYQKVSALKECKKPKIEEIKFDDLPSTVIRKQREWDALSPDEQARRETERLEKIRQHQENIRLAEQMRLQVEAEMKEKEKKKRT